MDGACAVTSIMLCPMGKKYVFAATYRGVSKINVFELNTGSIIGALPFCKSQKDLDYHSLRDEIWICCYAPNKEESYLDVVSASGISHEVLTSITFIDDEDSCDCVVTYPLLGDVSYATNRYSSFLYKIDLSDRNVMDGGKILVPLSHEAEELVCSQVNCCFSVRLTDCCTCGIESVENEPNCRRYCGGNFTVTTGPWAGPDIITS